jgi:hypothetical protein
METSASWGSAKRRGPGKAESRSTCQLPAGVTWNKMHPAAASCPCSTRGGVLGGRFWNNSFCGYFFRARAAFLLAILFPKQTEISRSSVPCGGCQLPLAKHSSSGQLPPRGIVLAAALGISPRRCSTTLYLQFSPSTHRENEQWQQLIGGKKHHPTFFC